MFFGGGGGGGRGGGGVIPYMVSTEWYSRNLGLNTMQADAWIFSPLSIVWLVQLNKMAGW